MNYTTALNGTSFLRGQLAGSIDRMIRAVTERYARRATLNELAALDSHMLDDIGLTRGDLNAVTFKRTVESRHRINLHDGSRC